jgi:outer membrane murein-binding lipoprotein Lpp
MKRVAIVLGALALAGCADPALVNRIGVLESNQQQIVGALNYLNQHKLNDPNAPTPAPAPAATPAPTTKP